MQVFKQAGVFALAFASLISVAAAAPIVTLCGSPINSIVKTNIDFFNTSSEIPVNLAGASAQFNVPVGESRCVRVRFSAVANCPHACFLRAFENLNELNPAWVVNPLRFSQDATNGGTAHSFEWVGRVGPGRHTITIKIQTGNSISNASIGPHTTTVEIMK
jgi:hypothetical protein